MAEIINNFQLTIFKVQFIYPCQAKNKNRYSVMGAVDWNRLRYRTRKRVLFRTCDILFP